MTSCIVLAAGSSKRFGSPKALAPISNRPSILYLLTKLCATNIEELIVVLGADRERIEPLIFKHRKIQVVHNNDHYLGQLSSIKIGVRASSGLSQALMVIPVDCPFVRIETFNRLLEHFYGTNPAVLIPTFEGHKGHPPVIHKNLKETILDLTDNQNLAAVLRNPEHQAKTLELPDIGIVQSFNTPDELKSITSSKINFD